MHRRCIDYETLNERQRIAHDLIIKALKLRLNQSVTDGGTNISRLQIIIGQGGSGKSHALDSVITSLKNKHGYRDDNFLVLAPTGKAASNISGNTIHSHKEGLSIGIKGSLKPLRGDRLKYCQHKYKNVLKIVFIDEYTMIRQQLLHYIDQRLRQIISINKPFGGLVIVLYGDPAQLPPAKGDFLWEENSIGDDFLGCVLCM